MWRRSKLSQAVLAALIQGGATLLAAILGEIIKLL